MANSFSVIQNFHLWTETEHESEFTNTEVIGSVRRILRVIFLPAWRYGKILWDISFNKLIIKFNK